MVTSFGTNTSSVPSFSFGSNNASSSNASIPSFSLNSNNKRSDTDLGGDAKRTAFGNGTSKPSTNFSFGSNNNTSGSLFSTKTNNTNMSTPSTSVSTSNTFGGFNTNGTTNTFGNPSGGLFSKPSTSTGSLFAANNNNNNNNNNNTPNSFSLFSNNNSNVSSGASLFNNNNNNNLNNQSGKSIFGTNNNNSNNNTNTNNNATSNGIFLTNNNSSWGNNNNILNQQQQNPYGHQQIYNSITIKQGEVIEPLTPPPPTNSIRNITTSKLSDSKRKRQSSSSPASLLLGRFANSNSKQLPLNSNRFKIFGNENEPQSNIQFELSFKSSKPINNSKQSNSSSSTTIENDILDPSISTNNSSTNNNNNNGWFNNSNKSANLWQIPVSTNYSRSRLLSGINGASNLKKLVIDRKLTEEDVLRGKSKIKRVKINNDNDIYGLKKVSSSPFFLGRRKVSSAYFKDDLKDLQLEIESKRENGNGNINGIIHENSNEIEIETDTNKIEKGNEREENNFGDYWSSPSIQSLQSLSHDQLSNIDNFIIGRKGYGQIAFNYPIDLTDFESNLKFYLFGKIIKFEKSIVNVYPENNFENIIKPPMGLGLNVPSTITIEKCFPFDKISKKKITDPSSSKVQSHVKRLKKQRGTEFVTYDPVFGNWVFKVKHFSIWGLVDDDDYESSDEEVEQELKQDNKKPEMVQNDASTHYRNSNSQFSKNQITSTTNDSNEATTLKNIQGSIGNKKNESQPQSQHKPKTQEMSEITRPFKSSWDASMPGGWSFDTDMEEQNIHIEQVDESYSVNDSTVDVDLQQDDLPMDGNDDNEIEIEIETEHEHEHEHENIAGRWGLIRTNDDSDSDTSSIDAVQSTSNTDNEIFEEWSHEQSLLRPKEPKTTNWDAQLQYGERPDSIFRKDTNVVTLDSMFDDTDEEEDDDKEEDFSVMDLDKAIFGDFEKMSSLSKDASKNLRLSPSAFCKWSINGKLIYKGELIGKSHSYSSSNTASSVSFKQIEEDSGSKTIGTNSIRNVFKNIVNYSKIEKRVNGFPKSNTTKELTFKIILENFNDNIEDNSKDSKLNSTEKTFWNLSSILFDDSIINDSIELENLPYDLKRKLYNKLFEQKKKQLLSEWLKNQVNNEINEKLSKTNDPLEKIYINICGNRITEATKLSIQSKNYHLSTLIPLLGSDDENIRMDSRSQLEYWSKNKTLNEIPLPIRKIYELLAGNTEVSYVSDYNMSKGFSWKVALGLKLWYESTIRDPISKSINSYEDAFTVVKSVPGPYSSNNEYDIYFAIIRLYRLSKGHQSYDLAKSLELFKTGSSILDDRIKWILFDILSNVKKLFTTHSDRLEILSINDKLTIAYSNQLTALGCWQEAVFILSFLSNENQCSELITKIISTHIEDVIGDEKIFRGLSTQFKVPERIIFESKALYYRYKGSIWQETDNLLKAGNWSEAHNSIIKNVGPDAIISKELKRLREYLHQFQNTDLVEDWSLGGQLYLNYIELSILSENGTLINSGNKKQLNKISTKLSKLLSQVSILNFKQKIAIYLMSDFVAKILLKLAKNDDLEVSFDISNILKMKMGTSENKKHTLGLALTHFKQILS